MQLSKHKPQIIFLIIGGLLLLISFLLSTQPQTSKTLEFLTSASQNIAFIILTVVIVDFLWGVLGGEPVSQAVGVLGSTLEELRTSIKLLADSKNTGMERAYSVSGDFGSHTDWMKRLKSAKTNIDLMGNSLYVWTKGENFEDEILNLVASGVNVRILVMDEDNKNFESLINTTQIISTNLASEKEELRIVRKVFTEISDRLDSLNPVGSFEFRTLQEGLILCQLCRTDNELTMIQYLYSVVTSRSPLFVINGRDTKLFEIYMREFDRLWELAERSDTH